MTTQLKQLIAFCDIYHKNLNNHEHAILRNIVHGSDPSQYKREVLNNVADVLIRAGQFLEDPNEAIDLVVEIEAYLFLPYSEYEES